MKYTLLPIAALSALALTACNTVKTEAEHAAEDVANTGADVEAVASDVEGVANDVATVGSDVEKAANDVDDDLKGKAAAPDGDD